MKNLSKYIYKAVIFSAVVLVTSCTSEDPFVSTSKGEGTISFNTSLHSDVLLTETRAAIEAQTLGTLEKNLLVYIERVSGSNPGVIRKYVGKESIPSSLTLAVGDYIIEGWTGDSASASFTDKYYRGKQEFTINEGANAPVSFKVNIANVIVTVDASNLEDEFQDLKVTVNHNRGSLVFDHDKIDENAKGYFMMPKADNETGYVKDLSYKVEVTSEDGKPIVKEGVIENVQRAHEYSLNISATQPDNTLGGALINVIVEDINVLDEKFEIFPAPAFKGIYGIDEIDIENGQIDCTETQNDLKLRVVAYSGLSNLSLTFDNQFTDTDAINGVNLWNEGSAKESAMAALRNKNISFAAQPDAFIKNNGGENDILVFEGWFTFDKSFFENLDPENTKEYVITVKATDRRGYSRSQDIRIAANKAAVENNLVGSDVAPGANDSRQPMTILATSAELTGTIYGEVTDYGIEYRKSGSSDPYVKVYANGTRASSTFTVTLTNLQPGTMYEYKAFATDSEGQLYEERNSRTFTTEAKFDLPYGDMNTWSKFSDGSYFPGTGNSSTFWDSGNHGAQMGGRTLTQSNSSYISGATVAELKSQSILGVMAAGNLFVGEYIDNVSTKGAKLTFGRPYNGSHPSALKVKVNYRPGSVNIIKSGTVAAEILKNGENDYGQIFIAISSQAVSLNTAEGIMFDPTASNILGYGEISWNENVGQDNQLEEITIPIKYNSNANSTKATHIIIVCSASKYGDYFSGSNKSVMYLDDFELNYGDIK